MNPHYPLNPALDHPAYHVPVKLPKYNGKVSALRAIYATDSAKILLRVHPAWSYSEHVDLAAKHKAEADVQSARYNALLDEAAMETFGRRFMFCDYKISAIGCAEFSESKKDALRFSCHAAEYHKLLNRAHEVAAKRLH